MIPSAFTNVYMLNFLVKFYQNILLWYPYFVLIFWTFIVNQSQTLSVSDVISVWSALCVMFYGVKLASSSLHKPLSHKTRINQLTISCWVAKVCLCSVRWHCEIINSVYTFFSCKQTIAACLDSRQLMGVNKLFADVPLRICHTSETFLLMIGWMNFEFYRRTQLE